MKKAPIALLLAGAATAIISFPSTAGAIEIHRHVTIHKSVRVPDTGQKAQVAKRVVRVVDVPAPIAPTPESAAQSSSVSVASPTPAPVSVPPPPVSSGGCPSYMAGEASSPSAVNPSSGAAGCFQVTPGTQAAMGAACSDVNALSCVGAICAAEGNGAWAASGSTPCDYIGTKP